MILNRFLRDLASSLLDISTGLVRDISTLLSGHRLVGGLGNLITNFLGHLAADWLRRSSFGLLNQVGIELVGNVSHGKENSKSNEILHVADNQKELIDDRH